MQSAKSRGSFTSICVILSGAQRCYKGRAESSMTWSIRKYENKFTYLRQASKNRLSDPSAVCDRLALGGFVPQPSSSSTPLRMTQRGELKAISFIRKGGVWRSRFLLKNSPNLYLILIYFSDIMKVDFIKIGRAYGKRVHFYIANT